MNCFTVLGIEPTTEKKTIKRAYAAKSREFHPEEHPEEFQRIHDAYEEALAWAERNAGRGEEPICTLRYPTGQSRRFSILMADSLSYVASRTMYLPLANMSACFAGKSPSSLL